MKPNNAVVLLSGGLDSTAALAVALKNFEYVVGLSILYGQKHKKELQSAKDVAEHYQILHYIIDLTNVFQFADNPLLQNSSKRIPNKSYAEQIAENGAGRVSTYVPFRNGVFLSVATAFADSMFPNEEVVIYYGAHKDDAAGEAYADCSDEFIYNINNAINVGTYGNISLEAPFKNYNKAEVVQTGLVLNAPFHLTWSCYKGTDKPCGECATCIDRAAAFRANNTVDPVK